MIRIVYNAWNGKEYFIGSKLSTPSRVLLVVSLAAIIAPELASLKGAKILNISAGENMISDAINIDLKAAKGIDLVTMLRKLFRIKMVHLIVLSQLINTGLIQ